MSDIFIPDLVEETATGIFARHAGRFTLPVLVAPTTTDRDDAHNRLRRQMVTVGCANLKDFAFAFDSSFLAPQSADGFDRLMKLIKLYPGCPISIFGHADPDGTALYNKFLSERRSQAVFGLLLFGPSRFPELTRRFGTGLREFKDAVSGHTDEIRDELSGFTETLAASGPAIDSTDQPPSADNVTHGILTHEHDTV